MNKVERQRAAKLAPFVPRLALDMAADGETASGSAPFADTHMTVDGSMLSADISGFTALSERLARKGREGAEELTALINACFTALIDTAASFGGEVIKFGGDALLVLFRGPAHQRNAGHAAQAMQTVLHQSVSIARRANLSMTVGVAAGPFNAFLVGSPKRELLICGPNATEVIRLEAEAGSGQILSSPSVAAAIVTDAPDGVLIWDPPDVQKREPVAAGRDLSAYVPTAVVEQLSAFSDTGGEHRLVAVGFVALKGIAGAVADLGGPATAKELGRVVNAINAACDEYSVTALHSDIAPDGVKFVLCAGAPLSAGNSSDALLQTALRISETESRFSLKQGVQRGRVFAGFLGSRRRRNYTLMGDPVNTAARMLGKADDREIIAVADVVRDTRSIFIAQELEPFLVKGKTDPIDAFRVLEITNEVRRSGEFADLVGRDDELALLHTAIEERGRFVHLIGPGGSGKSRLIDEVRDAVDLAGFTRFYATCSPYGSASPYALARALLRSGFGLDIHTDGETAGDLLGKVVKQYSPNLTPWLPLLAEPFGAQVDSTDEVDALGADFRRSKIHEVVTEFLDTAFDLSIAIVAEDLHWADEASRALLEHLANETWEHQWVTVITQRPTDDFAFAPTQDEAIRIDLAGLDDDAVRKLAIDVSSTPLSDKQLQIIIERAVGNPLFAIELVRAAERGSLDQLPDSVERLVSSRLDELSPDGRRLLRISSIFGMELKEQDLRAIVAVEAPDLDPPWEEVAEFLAVGPDGNMSFANIVTHDAAYEGLPFRARRRLHGLVGAHIENSTDHPERIAGLLAAHFSEAKQHPKSWKYGSIAGDAAQDAGANTEAVLSYTHAMDSARYVPKLDDTEIVRVSSRLAASHATLGHFPEAIKAFQYARKYNDDLATEVDLMGRLARVEEQSGDYTNALRWLSRGQAKLPEQTTDPDLLRLLAQIELERCAVYHRRGEHDLLQEAAKRALADAEASQDPSSIALANERVHLSMLFPHQAGAEPFGLRACEIYRDLNDHVAAARMLNNLGIDAYFSGQWTLAQERYGESMAEGLIAGSAIDGPMGGLNKGEILSDQGHWNEARLLLEDVLRNWRAKNYKVGIGVGEMYLGTTCRRMEQWDRAAELFESAAVVLGEAGITDYVVDAQSRRIELDVFRGQVDRAAIDAFTNSLADGHALTARMLRTSALAHHLAGQTDDAVTQMQAAAEATKGYERGIALRGLDHVTPGNAATRSERNAWLEEADEIFDRLGVTAIAAFPGS